MQHWKIRLHSSRTKAPVRAQLTLKIEADTREEAEALARESLPGFDWARWESAWGIVPDTIAQEDAAATRGGR